MANPIVRDDIVLDPYEQEIENASGKPIVDTKLDTQIKERIEQHQLKSVSFKTPKASFEIFKKNTKKAKIPYSKVLNALIDLYNQNKISLKI